MPSGPASVVIAVRRVRPAAAEPLPLPAYQTDGAAGMDLLADVVEPCWLRPGARALVPTGLAVEIPAGFEGQVRPRSGLALRHGVTLRSRARRCLAKPHSAVILARSGDGHAPFALQWLFDTGLR